ncbi:hypothetical protein [Gluconacetobacter takamatsuzukensis]|uniref:Uncharacterized protein n=1 Tax=Gluconacetobacter takamatsuzukensis TaxID=1286190 RepID=A0A7W4KFJ9_9PROT|nr:hypothetical protein [Gluconacetobacter takamatsuzukensis]MBB2206029.1 hypothetical protein [Gluconacetobacter takamatsuzukensis]
MRTIFVAGFCLLVAAGAHAQTVAPSGQTPLARMQEDEVSGSAHETVENAKKQPAPTPSAPASPSAMTPPSGGGYLQKDKKVPPSEKLSDWPQLKRDQVSPTPRAPCPGKADCKLVPMSRQDATKRLGHAPPGSETSPDRQGPVNTPRD